MYPVLYEHVRKCHPLFLGTGRLVYSACPRFHGIFYTGLMVKFLKTLKCREFLYLKYIFRGNSGHLLHEKTDSFLGMREDMAVEKE